MRIGQLGCDVELEVVVVRDHTVSQLDHKTASLFEGLYAQGGGGGGGRGDVHIG